MLKYEFKDATPERKQELLTDVISQYNVANRNELIQALGHAQALLDCTQEDFASHPLVNMSTRQLRNYKKEYLDLYTASFERYSATTPELKDIDTVVNEDVLESVYQNLLARLQSNKTSTKDLATILEYFGITANEFKQYTAFRNATMRGFLADNLSQIINDEGTGLLIKAIVAESPYLYQGTEKTLGNTYNAQNIEFDSPLVRLEAQTLGLLFMSLTNGNVTPAFVNHAETLRLLKLASGVKTAKEMEKSYLDFDRMNGKKPPKKTLTPEFEKELIDAFGKEMFDSLLELSKNADKKTAVKLPNYEDVSEDYLLNLKVFPEMESMPLKVLLAKLDAQDEKAKKSIKEKYKSFLDAEDNN